MSILAGYYTRGGPLTAPPVEAEILRILSGIPGAAVHKASAAGCLIASADLGCFQSRGFLSQPGVSSIAVAGHPYFDQPGDRERHAAHLRAELDSGRERVFGEANGSWCGAYFHEPSRTLTLVTDKLGLRPLYYWTADGLVVFSSALWILERLPSTGKIVDLEGATETVSFGFPLARRSAYRGIVRLYSGEHVRFGDTGAAAGRYFRLEDTPVSERPVEDLALDAAEAFRQAVSKRCGGDSGAIAFLSGGLDSRCIVSMLRERGSNVASYNFSLSGTLDSVLAGQYAQAAGTTHFNERWSIGSHVIRSLAEAWPTAQPPFPVEHPRIVWSGDGGSVGLGAVYITRQIESDLLAGRMEDVIAAYVRNAGAALPQRLLGAAVRAAAAAFPSRGVREELAALATGRDALRAFYFFLMFNDQRHHLAGFYESVHEHGYELHLPFFDGAFLETVARVPTGEMLYHRFYTHFLKRFPAHTVSVPWQAYVDHDPCPLPMPEGVVRQWTDEFRKMVNGHKRRQLLDSIPLIQAVQPTGFFNRLYLKAALLACKAGVTRYDYAVHAASGYAKLLHTAGGKYAAS